MSKKKSTSLTREDLRENDSFMVVDSLTSWYDWTRVIASSGTKSMVLAHKLSLKTRNKPGLKKKNIKEFTWHAFSYSEKMRSEKEAYDAIEKVYQCVGMNKSPLLKVFQKLYGTGNIELAFKKGLIVELAEYFNVANSVKQIHKKGRKVFLLPSVKWLKMHKWMKEVSYKGILSEEVIDRGLLCFRIFGEFRIFLEKLAYFFKFLALWICMLFSVRKICFSVIPKPVKLAIRMYRSGWGVGTRGKHGVDWLLDGGDINKENTIFVSETPLKKKSFDGIKEKQYTLVRQDYLRAFREVSFKFIFKDVFLNFFKCVKLSLVSLISPSWGNKIAFRVWYEFFRWQTFVEKWVPENYFTYNDLGYAHICRNIILSRNGCKSWLFEYSHSMAQVYDMSRSLTDVRRAFFKYDHELHWTDEHIAKSKEQFSLSGEYHAYGSLFSVGKEYERLLDDEGYLGNIMKKWRNMPRGLIVGCFTTINDIGGINGEESHFKFVKTMENLLNSGWFPHLKIIFKPKDPDYTEYMGAEGTDILAVFERLKAHPRFILVNSRYSFAPVANSSDVILSMAFASPGIESLLTGKKTIYYDPCGHFSNSFFDRFPELVAHNESGLFGLMEYWMGVNDLEFKQYLDSHVREKYGGKTMNRGIENVRSRISNG